MCFRPEWLTAGETGERGTACYNRREMIDDGPGEGESIWSEPSIWHGWYLGVFALFTAASTEGPQLLEFWWSLSCCSVVLVVDVCD